MNAQRDRARAASNFKMGTTVEYAGPKTAFRGYETLSEEGRVLALYKAGGFTILTPTVVGSASSVPSAISSELGS